MSGDPGIVLNARSSDTYENRLSILFLYIKFLIKFR